MLEDFVVGCLALVAVIILVVLTAFLCMCVWTATVERPICREFGAGMKLETQFNFWAGCFVVMPDGERLPKSLAEKVLVQRYKLQVEEK